MFDDFGLSLKNHEETPNSISTEATAKTPKPASLICTFYNPLAEFEPTPSEG